MFPLVLVTVWYTVVHKMASHYIRKNSPHYWIKYRAADGTRAAKSSGVKVSDKGGLRRVRNMVANITAQEQCEKDDGEDALFNNWVLSWFDYKYDNVHTNTRYKNAWYHLSAFLDKHNVYHPNAVTYQLCHQYMSERSQHCSWNTALVELRVLGAIEQEAVRRGYILANPCTRLKLKRKNTKQKREITQDEFDYIDTRLQAAPVWLQDAWLVGSKQGCRLSEVKVPMSDVDEQNGVITFHVKGGKTHSAPLHKDLLPLIARRREQEREYLVDLPMYASKLIIQWLRSIDVQDISFHCLRVTVVTRLARAGYSETQTMEYVGHCSEMVHSVYRKLKPADLKHLGDAL